MSNIEKSDNNETLCSWCVHKEECNQGHMMCSDYEPVQEIKNLPLNEEKEENS